MIKPLVMSLGLIIVISVVVGCSTVPKPEPKPILIIKSTMELKGALLSNADEFIVSDPKLAKDIIQIHKIRAWAFGIALVLLASAVVVAALTAGTGAVYSAAASVGVVSLVGAVATAALINLYVVFQDIKPIKTLRENYTIEKLDGGQIMLRHKPLAEQCKEKK